MIGHILHPSQKFREFRGHRQKYNHRHYPLDTNADTKDTALRRSFYIGVRKTHKRLLARIVSSKILSNRAVLRFLVDLIFG